MPRSESIVARSWVVATRLPVQLVQLILCCYRTAVSPFLAPRCRFAPSCSSYASEALHRHGVVRGGWMAVRRLLRCHPFHPGGWDPVV